MRTLLYNWEFKLIALLLAISLYAYTSDLITINRRLVIPVLTTEHISQTPEGFVVTGLEPRTPMDVYITGPRKLVQNLEEQLEIDLKIDLNSIKEGEQIFAINNALLGLDPKIKIEEIRPAKEITVKVSRQMYRTVPINTDLKFIGLPDDLLVPEVQLDKTDLEVYGPEDVVSKLEALEVEPVDLGRALANQEVRRAIERVVPIRLKLPPVVRATDDEKVYAKFILRPKMASREMNLPLSVLAEPEFAVTHRIEFASPIITVTVKGPTSYLGELKEDQLTAYVNISADQFTDSSSKRLPVYVQNPSWVSVGPSQVLVTVKKRTVKQKIPVTDQQQQQTHNNQTTTQQADNGGVLQQDDNEPIFSPDDEDDERSILPED